MVKRTAALLLVLLPALARAQEAIPGASPGGTRAAGHSTDAGGRSIDIEKEDAGFGQEEGEAPRLPRFRGEISALGAELDSEFRQGTAGLSNRFDPQSDLGLPRFTPGFRVSGVIKLHRYFALGAEYFHFGIDGERRTMIHHDFRMGPYPTEVTPGSHVFAAMELQQASFTARFVLSDDSFIRAEFSGGVTWVSYRLGLHPQLPAPATTAPNGSLPGGGFYRGDSESNEAWLAPAIGTFFAWNFHPNIALFFDSCSSYFSFWRTFGSIASINRAGLRWRIWDGLEIVTGAFVVSGQVYDIRDRLKFVGIGSSHGFHQASWLGGGPEIGISFTY